MLKTNPAAAVSVCLLSVALGACGGAAQSAEPATAATQGEVASNASLDVSTWPVRALSEGGASVRFPALREGDPNDATQSWANCEGAERAVGTEFRSGARSGATGDTGCVAFIAGERTLLTADVADLPPGVAFGRRFADFCRDLESVSHFTEAACDRQPQNGSLRIGFDPSDFHRNDDHRDRRLQLTLAGNQVIVLSIGSVVSNLDELARTYFDTLNVPAELPRAALPTTWSPLYTDAAYPVRVNMPEGTQLDANAGAVALIERVWAYDSAEARARIDFSEFPSPFGMGLAPTDAAAYRAKLQEQCGPQQEGSTCTVADDANGWPYQVTEHEVAPGVFRREKSIFIQGQGWIAAVMGPRAVLDEPAVASFFESFQLVTPPRAPAAPANNRTRARRR